MVNKDFEKDTLSNIKADNATSNVLTKGKNLNILKVSTSEFLNAKQEWLERYGDYIAQAKNWRLVSVIAIIISLFSVIGIIYIGSQNKIVPYVVQINSDGVATAIERAEKSKAVDIRVIKSLIARFVVNIRSVSVDAQIQKQMILDAFSFLSSNSPAATTLKAYFAQDSNNPFKRAQEELVNIEIKSILQATKDSWTIEWNEITRNRSGEILSVDHMKAIATILISPPSDEATILKNPLGVYVEDFTWTKQLN